MDLKILAWNVEHFKGPKAAWRSLSGDEEARERAKSERVARVVAQIQSIDPDIFAILEVEGDRSPYDVAAAMPDYSFLLTEGKQTQEILVGFRQRLRLFFTQKGEFKENNLYLRPAPTLSVQTPSGRTLTLLFGHFKSLPEPGGWGLRASMFEKLVDLKKALDGYAQDKGEDSAAFVAMGDLNTMGLTLTDADGDISADEELARCDKRLARVNMRRPGKSAAHTFSGGSTSSLDDSDLDHVYIDHSLSVLPENGFDVRVGGWTTLPTQAERDQWINDYSDHAPIWITLTGL
ncbi:hypothetical protein [Pacificoceanicola onchidii]|uniref:hypothetical protein n=1 Tax=Pacificoceanicola onchidii TaxID=2562685 RepID=UPI0010A5E57B|nr:hypothetical protein [Pacificoceanicola onchidii]